MQTLTLENRILDPENVVSEPQDSGNARLRTAVLRRQS